MTSAQSAAESFAANEHGLLIDGDWKRTADGPTVRVEDPARAEAIATVAEATPADVDEAVAAARRAQEDGRWHGLDPADRGSVLLAIAAGIRQRSEELAALETLDNGKPLKEARGDVAAAAAVFEYYAGWPTKLHGDTNPTESRFISYTAPEPIGVCAQIVPWNYPLLMASWKLGPALACGNTTVLKPAEQTPLSALRLGDLALEAGVPAGVLNVVTGGPDTGEAMVAHPGVDKVAFTGSTEVGRRIMAAAAPTLKRLTLELGGKNANIVFADADLDAAAEGAAVGAFENGGQACIAGSRVLVQRACYDDFVERLHERTERLVVADGRDARADIGALVSREHLQRVTGYVEIGREEGARVLADSGAIPGEGYFMRPAMLADVTADMRVAREEIFGPVAAVIPFTDDEEALRIANGTPYGLAAGVWTSDVGRAMRFTRELRAGTVWVNAFGSIRTAVSFGGVGQSGYGRDLGPYSIAAYTEPKSVFIDINI